MDSRIFRLEIIQILLVLLIAQVEVGFGRSHLPFLPTDEGIHVNHIVSERLGLLDNHGMRKRRNLAPTLSLLWPQVVGPIENGIIAEENYDSVPMTPIEHQLRAIRERSKIETATRQHVRDLLNFGPPAARLTIQQLYALHNDMTQFWNRHNQLHPGHFHAAHHIDPAALVIHHTILDQKARNNADTNKESLVIKGEIPGGLEIKTQTG